MSGEENTPTGQRKAMTPIGSLVSAEGRALGVAIKNLADNVNFGLAELSEKLGKVMAELAEVIVAVRELRASGGAMRKELDSVPDLATEAAHGEILALRAEIKAKEDAARVAELERQRAAAVAALAVVEAKNESKEALVVSESKRQNERLLSARRTALYTVFASVSTVAIVKLFEILASHIH